MAAEACFSTSYGEARRRFREAAGAVGANLVTLAHPLSGPEGEALACDTAWIGLPEAERVLVTISATHGIEGYCGSGAQLASLAQTAAELPKGLALLLIHGLNPHGFAHGRRVTEDNVDLNRNFPDFDRPLPANPGYQEIHALLCPDDWSDAVVAACERELERYGEAHGNHALSEAIAGGQYSHPDGIFYGGERPSWSHRRLLEIFRRHLGRARQVAVLDIHSGLGPYGYGELICPHPPGSAEETRAAAWYEGEITNPAAGTSQAAALHGLNAPGVFRALPGPDYTWIALEFGTFPLREMRRSLRADNWLYLHGELGSAKGRAIKAEIRRCFYPEAADWKEMVVERALWAQRHALTGLAEG
jgi:hypothetical protein